MLLPPFRRLVVHAVLLLLVIVPVYVVPQPDVQASTNDVSFWGMNVYLTKRERLGTRNGLPGDNLSQLGNMARAAGVQWTREELPWALIEPGNNDFRPIYDYSLKLTADKGFNIIGMLVTTPPWARDPTCRPPGEAYWCPPADVRDYADWVRWMVERYDGDGLNDAPGSPRIAAWQIWNEPNDRLLWPDIGTSPHHRKERYGRMLVAAYQAVKQADPTAIVLIGGMYIFDGNCHGEICDGLNFLNADQGVFKQVPAAREAFDVFAIHPFIPTARPDGPEIVRLVTVEGRIRSTRAWLDRSDVGRPEAPIWITEIGWCTGPGVCPAGVQVSEDAQANYLVRSLVIAQHNGVRHASWFQFEDAFNDPNREWANAAIVRHFDGTRYAVKPAYGAYQTLSAHLQGATIDPTVPIGPVHSHRFDPSQPYEPSGNGVYNYRYRRGATTIDVLWVPSGTRQVQFPVIAGRTITRVDRDGAEHVLEPVSGQVNLTLSERPFLLIQGEPAPTPRLHVSSDRVLLLAQTGMQSVGATLRILNTGKGTLNWSARENIPWLSLSTMGGATPGSLEITVHTANLPADTYYGTLYIAGDNGVEVDVPVQVVVARQLKRVYLPWLRR